MREIKKTFIYCIKADNPNDFNQQTKAFCQDHTVTRITPYPDFLAYIEYEKTETHTETRLEEYEQNKRHYCGECPFLESSKDARRKKMYCPIVKGIRWKDSPACEQFYLKGELDEERISEPCRSDDRERMGCRGAERRAEDKFNSDRDQQITRANRVHTS